MTKYLISFGFFCLTSFSFLFAQEEVELIAPDRPGFGDAISIIPKKQLQVETGFWFDQDNQALSGLNVQTTGIGINSTLLRYGLSEKIELRFDYSVLHEKTVESYFGINVNKQTGLLPCRVGMKAALTENKGIIPAITFVGMIGMPWTSSVNFRPKYVSPDLQLSCSNQVNSWFTICYNLGSSWDGDLPNPQHYYALSGEFAPSDKWGGYVQVHGSLQNFKGTPSGTQTDHLLYSEAGLMYYPKKNIQIDLSGGTKIGEFSGGNSVSNGEHSYFFTTAGLSWRFPR
jgi:hypothetical protein